MNLNHNPQFLTCPKCGHQLDLDDAIKRRIEEGIQEGTDQIKVEHEAEMEAVNAFKHGTIRAGIEEGLTNNPHINELESQCKEQADTIVDLLATIRTYRLNGTQDPDLAAELHETQQDNIRLREINLKLKQDADNIKRTADQVPSQIQGAALQLSVGEQLRKEFWQDKIEDLPNGAKGADHVITVRTDLGKECEKICIEDKTERRWNTSFVTKLREDMLRVGAVQGVIISTRMPKGLRLGGPYGDRVWVVTPALALLLIKVLREGIEDHANAIARYSTDAKTAAEETWEYLGSEDFQQRVLIMFTSISKLKKEDENSCKRRHPL